MAKFVNVRPAEPPQPPQPPPTTILPKLALYSPAPRPDVPYETLEPDPDDILLSGSSDYDSDETRTLKQKRRRALGQDWLQGRPVHLISTAIKGPLHEDWKSPWAKAPNMGVQHRHGRGFRKPSSSNNHHVENINKSVRRNFPGSRTKKSYSNLATHTSQSQLTRAAFSREDRPPPVAMADQTPKSFETRARPRAPDNHAQDSHRSTPVPVTALRRHLKSLQELIGDANSMSEIRQLNDEMASVLVKLDRFRESYPSNEGRRGTRKRGPVNVERSDPFARTGEFPKRQKPLTYPEVPIPKASSNKDQSSATSPSPPTRASAQEKSITRYEKLYVSSADDQGSKASSIAKDNTSSSNTIKDGSRGTKRKSEEKDAELLEPHETESTDKKSKDRKKKKKKNNRPVEGGKEHDKENEKKKRKMEAPASLESSETTSLDTEIELEKGKKQKQRKNKKEKRGKRRKEKKNRIPYTKDAELPPGHNTISYMSSQTAPQNHGTGSSRTEPLNHRINKHAALFSTRLKEAIASANVSANEEVATGPCSSEISQEQTNKVGNSSAEKLQKNPNTVITPTHGVRHPAKSLNSKATTEVSSSNRRTIGKKTGGTKHGTIRTPNQARYERERDALFAKADSLFLLAKEHASQLSQGCTPTSGSPVQLSQDSSVNHAPGNGSSEKLESRPKRIPGELRPSYHIDSDDSDEDPQVHNGSDYFTPGSSTNGDAVDLEPTANLSQVARKTLPRSAASTNIREFEHRLINDVENLTTSVNDNCKQVEASKAQCAWKSGLPKGSTNRLGSRSAAVLRRGMSLPPLPSQCERHGHSPCACGITIRVPISSDPQGPPESPTPAIRETSRVPRSGPNNKGNVGIVGASDALEPSSPLSTIHLDTSKITGQRDSPEDSDAVSSYPFDEDEFDSAIKAGPYLKLLGLARRSIAGSQEQVLNEAQEIPSTELPAPSLELHTEQPPSEAVSVVNKGTSSSTQAQIKNAGHSLPRDAEFQMSKERMAPSTNDSPRQQSAAFSVVSKPVNAVLNFFYGSSQPNSPEKSFTPNGKGQLQDVDLHKAAKETTIDDELAEHSKGREHSFEAASRFGYYGQNDPTSPPHLADGDWSSDDSDFKQLLQSLAKNTPTSKRSGAKARSKLEPTPFPEPSISSERGRRNDQEHNLARSSGSASIPHTGEQSDKTPGSVMHDAQKVSLSYPGVDFNLTDAEIDEALTDAESFLHTDAVTHYENLTQRSGTKISSANNRRGSTVNGGFDGRRSSGASRVSFVDIP